MDMRMDEEKSGGFVIDDALTEAARLFMPFAQFIGLLVGHFENEEKQIFKIEYKPMLIGSTLVNSIHGGFIGGFMECAAANFTRAMNKLDYMPRTIDYSIDYLRPGLAEEPMYCECKISKQGNRIAFVSTQAWQTDYFKPTAKARVNFLMEKPN